MGYRHLLELIGGRDVILDECNWFYGLPDFLDSNGINWSTLPGGTKDEALIELRKPNEVIITMDRKLALRLGSNAIRLPIRTTPNKRKISRNEKFRIQRELEIEEFIRDYEMGNTTKFNIMRGMRMLFCKPELKPNGKTMWV